MVEVRQSDDFTSRLVSRDGAFHGILFAGQTFTDTRKGMTN
jgi:hypothetical protein